MKQRVHVGTDVALLGVWDEACEVVDFSKLKMKEVSSLLYEDSAAGKLFLMELGADWSGTVDVYVNGEIEPEVMRQMSHVPGEFLIALPSGRTVVGGAEDYRSAEAKITSESSVVAVNPGDYGLQCFVQSEAAEVPDMPEPEKLEKAVGSDLFARYQKWSQLAARGFWLLLLFFPITYWFGWIAGIIATIVLVLGYFHLIEWLQKKDPKYVEAIAAVEEAIRAGEKDALPNFALILRGPLDAHRLAGGHVDVSKF